MKINNKGVRDAFLSLVFFVLFGCAYDYKYEQKVFYVEPPKWVRFSVDNDGFSAIGLTGRPYPLNVALLNSKRNAIENLKTVILVKIEDLLSRELISLSKETRDQVIASVKYKVNKMITYDFLTNITRVESVWKSLENNILYVKVVSNSESIAYRLYTILEIVKEEYMMKKNVLFLIDKIEYDVLYNNMEVSTVELQSYKSKNILSKKKDITLINSDFKSTKKKEKKINSVIENNFENENKWSILDDEIDLKINEVNELQKKQSLHQGVIDSNNGIKKKKATESKTVKYSIEKKN